jgi:indolepyruvate ferredoxin oxidoreductase alpha subunit
VAAGEFAPAKGGFKPGFVKDPARRVALPAHARPLHAELLAKQAAIEGVLEATPWNRLTLRGDHGVIASGIAGLYAEEAIADLDMDLSFLRIGTFPAPSRLIKGLLSHVSRVLVVEELEPVLEEQVERIALEARPDVEILGKTAHISRAGELDFLQVRNAIARMEQLPLKAGRRIEEAIKILPQRPPALCPGCSHRSTYYAMRKAFGKNAIYPSDIGCYTMAVNMGTVDTCLCMGASITLASGIRFGGEREPICCSLGDSTFLHGGLAGLLNAAYNKARITVTVLDNSTTAMTGHQPHPGTGFTATGEPTTQVSLEAVANALGAGLVETIDPYDLEGAIEGFKRAKEFSGLSVIIARQACVIKARRSGAGRKTFAVGEDCVGCGLCIDFGCPAIESDGEGEQVKARINALCIGCGVCAQICPSSCIAEVKR